MSVFDRRKMNKLLLGSMAAASAGSGFAGAASRVRGVQLGVQTYSFRALPLDRALEAMKAAGITSCELWTGTFEPPALLDQYRRGEWDTPKTREMQASWRQSVTPDELRRLRARFERAGVQVHALNYSIRDHFTDEEIDLGFRWARSLGAEVLTSSSNVSTARRIDPIARKHRMRIGMHNHSDVSDRNEFATPESFARAMQGASEYIAINLDIGHFVAAGFDPVEFLSRHHERIVALHIKDRKRDQGANVPFGEGDTPIKGVLTVMRDRKLRFPANIEYEYEGAGDPATEVRRCVDYCKRALEA